MIRYFLIVLFSVLFCGCKTDQKSNSVIEIDYEKKIIFYRDLILKEELANPTIYSNSPQPSIENFSKKAKEKLNRRIYDIVYLDKRNLYDTIYPELKEKTVLQQLFLVDSLYTNKRNYKRELHNLFFDNWRHLMFIEKIENNIVTISDAPGNVGSSQYFEKYLVDGDNVNEIKFPETEWAKMEKIVKEKLNDYSHISRSSDMIIKPKSNGIFEIKRMGLKDGDGEAYPAVEITFESKDFKTIDLNSVKVRKL
ncbi:hypothetical protein ACFPVY_08415 [Flavobacterium qiangtangense]|uniref:Uncharacterized protein n=1 Tax=Flavobacterium qiangtangense TaxID=1442595 RepID=A0ABW1PM84_9FLAO